LDGGEGGYALLDEVEVEEGRGRCGGVYPFGLTADVRAGPDHKIIQGTWNPHDDSWIWQLPPIEQSPIEDYCWNGYMNDGGRIFYFCGHLVHGRITPGSSELTTISPLNLNAYALRGQAEGDLGVWPDGRNCGHGRDSTDIKAWAPDGKGLRLLFSALEDATCAVALSDTHLAGYTIKRVRGGGCDGAQPEARLWMTPRIYAFNGHKDRSVSPIITDLNIAIGSLHTWGDFIAAMVGFDPRDFSGLENSSQLGGVIVARTTDWSFRWIPVEPRTSLKVGLDSDYVYLAPEQIKWHSNGSDWRSEYIYRYDLSRFDEIGKPVSEIGPWR
jgi:hypothetical protein